MDRRLALAAALAAACLASAPTALAQAGKPQETSLDGITVEVTEVTRKEGVLTVKARYRNTGDQVAIMRLYRDWGLGEYYVTAGSTKLMALKDSKGVFVATPHGTHGQTDVSIKPKSSFLFWAKYPAPPEDTKKVNFFHPHSPPIEDIPITDVK